MVNTSVRNWRRMKERTPISSCSFCRWVGRRHICEVTEVTLEWSRWQGRWRRVTGVGLGWHNQGTYQASPTHDPAYTCRKDPWGFHIFYKTSPPWGGWGAQLVRCLSSTQITISGSWDEAPRQAPWSAGNHFSISLCSSPTTCVHSLSLSNK